MKPFFVLLLFSTSACFGIDPTLTCTEGTPPACDGNTLVVCVEGGFKSSEDCGQEATCDATAGQCRPIFCGNGVTEGSEACDEGANNQNGGTCEADCTLPACGNRIVDNNESCDDGNNVDADSCHNDCTVNIPAGCGNNINETVAGEECDDGNNNSGDTCDANCQLPSCGNGITAKDGAGVAEECDDGNVANNDGCSSTCKLESCGDGVKQTNEPCDDGNNTNTDACKNNCTLNICSDGILNVGVEECDDSNTATGDGCDAGCIIELFLTNPTPQNITLGAAPTDIIVGRFNNDAFDDLVVTNQTSNTLSILLGNGTSGFNLAPNVVTDNGVNSVLFVVVGRFNNDTFDDLAVNNIGEDLISVFLGNGDGTFSARIVSNDFLTGDQAFGLAIGQFNADSFDDLVVANRASNNVSVLLGNGAGGFGTQTPFPVGAFPTEVAVGRFNSDSFDDIAVSNENDDTVSILLGNGAGGFSLLLPDITLGVNPSKIIVGRFNNDAFDDLVVADRVMLGDGNGGFAVQPPLPISGEVSVGFFNNDNIIDLVNVNGSNTMRILVGNGDGTFFAAQTIFSTALGPTGVAVGRFNNDGFDDVAVSNNSGSMSLFLSTP